MKKTVLYSKRPEVWETLPAISYLLLIALIAVFAGVASNSEQKVLLFPSALVSLLLLFGITGKKMLQSRKGGNVGLATA